MVSFFYITAYCWVVINGKTDIFNPLIHSNRIEPYPFVNGCGIALGLCPILLGGSTYSDPSQLASALFLCLDMLFL